jgi:hypothetical protein
MRRFFFLFQILMLAGVQALVLSWTTPDSFDKKDYGELWQSMTQSHDDEAPDDDDEDEEKEDDDYD